MCSMQGLCVYILGEPPSQVEFTSAPKLDGNEVIVAWKAPGIPNGVIQSYQVQVKLLNKEGHAVFAKIYPIMVCVWLHTLLCPRLVHVCAHYSILPVFAGKYYILFLQSVGCEHYKAQCISAGGIQSVCSEFLFNQQLQ